MPVFACGFAENVSVELPVAVTGFGENLAVTFAGTPEALRVTELLAPTAVSVIVPELFLPLLTVTDIGAEMVKSPAGAFTVTFTVVVCVRVPSVPLTVSAMLAVNPVTVRPEVTLPFAAGVTGFAEKLHVAVDGQLVTESVTALL